MAKEVRFAIPERKIDNTGVTFSRSRDGYKDGDIRIQQNFIDWRPSGNQFIYHVSWGAFAHFAEENDKRIRPRTNFVCGKKKLTNIAA